MASGQRPHRRQLRSLQHSHVWGGAAVQKDSEGLGANRPLPFTTCSLLLNSLYHSFLTCKMRTVPTSPSFMTICKKGKSK